METFKDSAVSEIERVFGELVVLRREESSLVRMYRHEALKDFPPEDRREICRMMVACLAERAAELRARRLSFAGVPEWLRRQSEEALDGHVGMVDAHLRRWRFKLEHEEGRAIPKKFALDKDELRARIDVIELVGQFTKLKLRGDRAMGKCIFHEDRVESMSVDRKKGLWNCFAGCGGGDAFTFIMKKYGKTFAEAVEIAAELV